MTTDEPADDGEYDPTDAFGAVSNETRIAVIRALVEEQRRLGRDHDEAIPPTDFRPVLSFSELRSAVGVDDSGQFNYHLEKLVGRYVARTEDGYTLTWAGIEIAGSILAGGYGDLDVERQPIDRRCPSCGGQLEAEYTAGALVLYCSETGDMVLGAGVPTGVFEGRSLEAAADVAEAVQRRIQDAVIDGYCPTCYGRVEARIGRSTTQQLVADEYALRGRCDRCGNRYIASVAALVTRHPAVVAFYHDRGIDIRDRMREPFETTGTDEEVTVVAEDPLRVAVTFEADGDSLRVVVGEDGDVVETTTL
jgi:hypothetical protein